MNHTSERRVPGRHWLALSCALSLLVGATATAATFTVDATIDERDDDEGDGICATRDGDCTLRAAVEETNALAGADIIILPAGTYLITERNGDDNAHRGDFDINDDLTILGAGESSTIVDGDASDQVFELHAGFSLTMSDLTIRNGDDNKKSGGMRSEGALSLTNVTFRDNVGKEGGGLSVRQNGGSAILTNVTFLNNSADKGAGLHVKDNTTVTIVDSSFSGNVSSREGAGAFFDDATFTLTRSTLNANTGNEGGGVYIRGDAVGRIENVTISGNTADKEGGGIQKEGNGTTDVVNVTLYGNSSPKGANIRMRDGNLNLLNTIVAAPVQDVNCDGAPTSLGYNLDTDGSCALALPGDIVATSAVLTALQDNGGTTLTHAPLSGSPVVDAGTNAGCPATDQIGQARPADGDGDLVAICEIGAYEGVFILYPDFTLQKNVFTVSDPFSGGTNPKAIPGAVMQYSIQLGNNGPGMADADSLIITESLPAGVALVVTDFDLSNPGPVAFVDGSPASGLSYSFTTFADNTDDIEFSDDGGSTYTYEPVPSLIDGTDSSVTHFRILPKGGAAYTGAFPVAEFLFRVVVR